MNGGNFIKNQFGDLSTVEIVRIVEGKFQLEKFISDLNIECKTFEWFCIQCCTADGANENFRIHENSFVINLSRVERLNYDELSTVQP